MRLLGAFFVCLSLEANQLRIAADKTAVRPGETVTVSITLETAEAIAAIQWEEHSSAAPWTQTRSIAPQIVGKDLRCGERLCVLYGLNRDPLSSGLVAVWTLSVPYAASRGTLAIEVASPRGADPDGNSVAFTDAPAVLLEVIEDGVPEFHSDAVVDAATFQPGAVPGSLATIFGRGFVLLPEIAAAGGALEFAGLTVAVNGIPAPLLTAGRSGEMEQVNLQVPFEVLPGVADFEIRNPTGRSLHVSGIPVHPVRPTIFAGGVVHQDGHPVTAENPAKPGEAVSVYMTGGGPVAAAVTGQAGPEPPLFLELPVSAIIDGVESRVLFAGYAPKLLGVYQINLEIPEISGRRMSTLVIEIGSGTSNPIAVAVN